MTRSSDFPDHFSHRAPGYAVYRPSYPKELVDYLADLTLGTGQNGGVVWEAGCGSGQLTLVLVERFGKINATDASQKQLSFAKPHPSVEYRTAPAEASGLPDASVDLAVAAQAAHWFNLDRYYAEVRRVLRPGGIIALVVYGIHETADPKVDEIIKRFYHQTLAGYWPPERKFVEDQYRNISFPFEEIKTPPFQMQAEWSLDEMLGYVETWSAVSRMIESVGRQPFDELKKVLAEAWGPADTKRTIRWPLALRAGVARPLRQQRVGSR